MTVSPIPKSLLASLPALFLSFCASMPPPCAAFVAPSALSAQATVPPPSRGAAASAASSAASPDTEAGTAYHYDGYDKPVVLLGVSSSPRANELAALARSLSGALAGNNSARLRSLQDGVGRSLGAALLGDEEEDDDNEGDVAGIALSAVSLDPEEGPFVFDAAVLGELIREKALTLASGVIALDFNHAAFTSTADYNAKEFEAELTEAAGALAKQLYKDEGLLCVYVNVQPDEDEEGGEAVMRDEARARRRRLEKKVFLPYSDYELCIKNEGAADHTDTDSWQDVEWELQRIVARALLPPPVVGATGTPNSADLVMGMNTFFLSLSFPNIEEAGPYVEQMCADVDSMEYRVDLLAAANDYLAEHDPSGGEAAERGGKERGGGDARFEILYQQQRLRALCRPHAQRAPALPFAGASVVDDALPIVFTVRTAHQAGTWPDDEGGIARMFELLELGLRSAAEVLDVESAWDAGATRALLDRAEARYTSLILGSHHVVGRQVDMDEAVQLYRQCRIDGRAHGAKVVLSITSNDNEEDQLAYRASLAASKLDEPEIPHISLVLGEDGSYSRILNPRFTPVTHEALPAAAAPGQLTAAEIMAARMIMGQIPSQRYAILGHNIAYSVSPQMQGGAFVAVKLPHAFARADVEDVQDFVEGPIWNDDNFGGCCVTIPHKQAIIPHVDVLTDAAKEIGSVNTVIVKKDKFGKRVLIGENTDWRGIYNPLRRCLGKDAGTDEGGNAQYALILGGGGTARAAAYAASKLGLERIYFNRTPEKAMDLAKEFGGVVASSLMENGVSESDADSLGAILARNEGIVQVVISTLPAAAKFELPDWMLRDGASLPVIFDVNYKPYSTALLSQAVSKGCDVVRGSEMLWEQGVRQFELWTERTAPYGYMKKVVLENCLPKETEEKEKE